MIALPLLGLLLTITAWVLTVMTGAHLISGPFEDRTCQTECVRMLFFSGVGVTLGALLFAIPGLLRPNTRTLTYVVLVLMAPLVAVYATLFLIGNFA